MTNDGIRKIIDTSQSKLVVKNKEKILDLLKEAHASASSATHVATPGASGKKRSAAPQMDQEEEEGDVATQHIQKIHRNASECVQQLERVVGYNGAVVAGTKDVVEYTRVAKACSMQLQRVNTEAQNIVRYMHESIQQLDPLAANYDEQRNLLKEYSSDMKEYMTNVKECTVDLEVLGTAAAKVGQAFATLTTNHAAYLQVKREELAIDTSKMDKVLDFETRMTVFEDAKAKRVSAMEDAKVKSAKAMLEIEKERAELQQRAGKTENKKTEDPTLTTFTINELCKKHKLLEGIDPCHYFEIFKRAGELSAIEHKANEWKFADRRDGKSNAYPMQYETAKLAICKHTIAQFKAKQLAKMRHQAADEGQQTLDAYWTRCDDDHHD